MSIEQFQVNTKFLNSPPPEWSKFVTDVKLVKDLHTTNFDQLHAYLEQHELHANEVHLIRERNQDLLALVANHQMTPSHFNTYLSSYNNPEFQQQFSLSQSPQYGSTHPTQHYLNTYPFTPLAITYPSSSYPNAYSSNIHQEAFPVFKQGDDPIDAINKMMSFMSTVATSCFPTTNNYLRNSSNPKQQATIHDGRCPNPKRKKDATWFRNKVLLVETQGNGKVLNEEELEFLAVPGIVESPVSQSVITHNAAYQANDLDAYDFDCDEISTAKAVLIANLSNYSSDVLYEIRPMFYDGNVIAKQTNVISIDDLEETLMLEDESRSKMLLKQSNPKVLEKKINIKPVNYAILNQLSEDFDKLDAPSELPKYSVDKRCLEIANNQVLNENDRLLEEIISQDIVNIAMNLNASVNVNENSIEMFNKCLELEVELIKQYNMIEKDEYNKLLKNYSQLEQHCISLELAM
ncbi:hypothetical protein Tco_0557915 [Tanacetum coccineum]